MFSASINYNTSNGIMACARGLCSLGTLNQTGVGGCLLVRMKTMTGNTLCNISTRDSPSCNQTKHPPTHSLSGAENYRSTAGWLESHRLVSWLASHNANQLSSRLLNPQTRIFFSNWRRLTQTTRLKIISKMSEHKLATVSWAKASALWGRKQK